MEQKLPLSAMLACLVAGTALGYTAQQGQQGQMKEEVFDASTCKSLSGTDHDTEWCVANCGKDTNPICPISFCKCEGTMPTPEELGTADLTPEEKAAKKKVDDAVTERDAGIAAATAERDADIAKRDEEIAKAAQAQSDHDAEIAKRDAEIAAREPAVAETTPASTDAAEPSPVAVPSPAAPAVDWATGAELPQAPTAVPWQAAPIAAAPVPNEDNANEWDESGWEDEVAVSEPAPLSQKGHTLPTTYYINRDGEPDMKERLEGNASSLPGMTKLVRISAVEKDEFFACLKDGSCGKAPEAQVLGLDFMNTEGFLYWKLHEMNVFSPGEFGCTFSHLRAIHKAFIDGEQTALIVEVCAAPGALRSWMGRA